MKLRESGIMPAEEHRAEGEETARDGRGTGLLICDGMRTIERS